MNVGDVFIAKSLLEIDLERTFGRGNFGFEPSAEVLDGGHRIRFAASDIEDGVRVSPGDKEADCLFGSVLVGSGYGCVCSSIVNGDIDFSNVRIKTYSDVA